MGFKDRLKEARLKKGYTQEQVAEKIGVAKSTFTGYEKGNREPNMFTVSKILDALEIDANFLWQDEMGSNYPMKVSYPEYQHIEKYRSLDSHGKETVSYILQREISRTEQLKSATALVEFPAPDNGRRLVEYFHSVSAGTGVFILGNEATDQISIPDIPEYKSVDFAVDVSGSSMEPDFMDGDIVLVSSKKEMRYGDVGIFIVNSEAFIKEYGEKELVSRNPIYDNITISEYDNIVCMGKVVGKLN